VPGRTIWLIVCGLYSGAKGGCLLPDDYVTIQGDTWDIVSKKVYGAEKYMDRLITANTAHREIVFFAAGARLVVPKIDESMPETLPPWKRG
jgi:phage tail protein X